MNPFASLGVSDYMTGFVNALEFVDEAIAVVMMETRSPWRTLIPHSAYQLGQGLERKMWRFHPGRGDQRGLQRWRPIQVSAVGEGEEAGVDACAYQPYLVQFGSQQISYTGLQTERRTRHICIRDIRFNWQFETQLKNIMSFLPRVTVDVWENYHRESYLYFSQQAAKQVCMVAGYPGSSTFSYNPFSIDDDGDNTLTFARGTEISTMAWDTPRRIHRELEIMAPGGALAHDDRGRPVYGLVMDAEEIDKMITRDAELREDFRHAKPNVLIDNYGNVDAFKGWSIMHDPFEPRFSVKSITASVITLKREQPFDEDVATTVGNRVQLRQEYLNAEYAIATVLLNNVFNVEVPPAGPATPAPGLHFGASPSLNGEFEWINIKNETTNVLGENGFAFGRYEAFNKPGISNEYAYSILYKRCVGTQIVRCEIVEDGSAEAVYLKSADDVALVAGSDYLTQITLAGLLAGDVGDEVTVTVDAGTTVSAIIADASAAPTYILAFIDGARPAVADMNDPTTTKVVIA